MTETESTKSKMILDFDHFKHQDWLRRRKLRLEQVRKQSSELAKMLRQKGMDEEKTKEFEEKRKRETELMFWRAVKLEELEEKFSYALEEFGKGHKLAEEEPVPEEVIEARNNINFLKAQERGAIAQQNELKRKKLELSKKNKNVERKKMTRKIEDLRSALIRTVPVQKKLINSGQDQNNIQKEENAKKREILIIKKKVTKPSSNQENKEVKNKVILKKVRKKRPLEVNKTNVKKSKNSQCKNSINNTNQESRKETVWINLNDIMSSSGIDTGSKCGSAKSKLNTELPKDKSSEPVVFYNHSSRSYHKSFKDFPHLVEKIDPRLEPNANELAKLEEEEKLLEAKKRQEMEKIAQERGAEALKKEKINRDYNNLIAKLEDLHKKEKILKAQQKIPLSLIHMNDERLSERTKSRQKVMNSKFESILYNATAGLSLSEPRNKSPETYSRGDGDFKEMTEQNTFKLSFSPSNLKTNSPATMSASSSIDDTVVHPFKATPFVKEKEKKKLLKNIDRALKESRELRKTVSQNRDHNECLEEINCESDKKVLSSKTESPKTENCENLVLRDNKKPEIVIKSCDRETQTDLINIEGANVELSLKPLDISTKAENESLPISTSTSYKSPPSVIHSCRLRQFLEYLEGLSDTEDNETVEVNPKIKKKLKSILADLLYSSDSHKKKIANKPCVDQNLEYYILKLLNMSRECVAELSVSSENMSTPTIKDLDLVNENNFYLKSDVESEHSCHISPKGEDLVTQFRLKRAENLKETIKNWRTILEKNDKHPTNVEQEDEPDFSYAKPLRSEFVHDKEPKDLEIVESVNTVGTPEGESKYDRISKKCSERISALSELLDKVRKDKEKLLNSTSGTSSLSVEDNKKITEDIFNRQKQKKKEEAFKHFYAQGDSKHFLLESFLDRYNLPEYKNDNMSVVAVVDPQSPGHSSTSSSDSFPDVMDELLKRKVLTSPFKWAEGETAVDLASVHENSRKPSSIETVIGNFRKEMSNIKPVSLIFADSNKHLETLPSNSRRLPLFSKESEVFESQKRSEEEKIRKKISEESYQEESSIDSINRALTSLRLNWAKTFLKKNEESKAISSSSDSDGEHLSDDETRNYY